MTNENKNENKRLPALKLRRIKKGETLKSVLVKRMITNNFGKPQFIGAHSTKPNQEFYLPAEQQLVQKILEAGIGSPVKITKISQGSKTVASKYEVIAL